MEIFIFGIVLNTVAFGLMGATNKQNGIPHLLPRFLVNPISDMFTLVLYIVSFIVILLSPVNFLLRIIAAILMQFVVNHFLWGLIVGTIAAIDAKKRINNS